MACAVGATVDLSGKPMNTLKYVDGIFSAVSSDPVLVIDLASHSQSFLMQNKDKSVMKVNLKLPTTLLKRPVYGFAKLIDITLDDERKALLLDLIRHTKTVVFFDNVSSFHRCLMTTYYFIEKFISYVDNSLGTEMVYVLSPSDEVNSIKFSPVETTSKKRRLNLKLEIPKKDVFVSSFKKNSDTTLYTPNSLKTYFQFRIPEMASKECLPQWLKFYSDAKNKDTVLTKIYDNFKLLEVLETKRLERCLNYNNNSSTSLDSDNSQRAGSSKIYSLSHLQKQYKHSKRKKQAKDLKITIPTDVNSSKSTLHSCTSTSSFDTDSDILDTPANNYEISKGIQSLHRNTYSNILPYEHTRVKLEPSPVSTSPMEFSLSPKRMDQEGADQQLITNYNPYFESEVPICPTIPGSSKYNNKQFNDYFNASYLNLPQINPDFHYIATQAPLPSTVDDFWKVVMTSKVKIIISLNSDDELNMKKWDIYWNSQTCHKYIINITDIIDNVCGLDGCVLRVFNIKKNNDKETKQWTVYQIQYKGWLDSCGVGMKQILTLHKIKAMLSIDPIRLVDELRKATYDDSHYFEFVSIVDEEIMEKLKCTPVLVHCSAGCGRTGVFITLDFLLNILCERTNKSNKIDVWNASQDLIFIIVNELRRQRVSMVQNLTQYITCYQALLEFFSYRDQKLKSCLHCN